MISYWETKNFIQKDIVIIGSGITGLSAAAYIKEHFPSRNVTIFEMGIFPSGASTKNAGFACFGSLSEIVDDLITMPESQVVDLIKSRLAGLEILKNRLGEHQLDFQMHGGYELIKPEDTFYLEKIDYINNLLSPIFGRRAYELRDSYIKRFGFDFTHVKHLVYTPFEGQIDTGKMMHELISYCRKLGVEFYTNTEIQNLDDLGSYVQLQTKNNINFKANKVLIATNGFAKKLLSDNEVVPGRGITMITKPIPGLKLLGTYHLDRGYYYFRNYKDRLIIGGGRNLDFDGENTFAHGINPVIIQELIRILHEVVLPGHKSSAIEIDQKWSGIMGFRGSKSIKTENISTNVSAGVGLGGMGIAIGSLIGEKLAKMIM